MHDNYKQFLYDWKLGHTKNKTESPDVWINAKAPGAVQVDWIRENKLPDYNMGSNVKDYEWMHDMFWHYKTSIQVEGIEGKDVFLIFESIEYKYEIYIENRKIYENEGMYSPIKLSLNDYIGQRIELYLLIYPAHKVIGAKSKTEEHAQTCKPAFAYGWDWSPRLIALGLSGQVYLEYMPESRIEQFLITYSLSDDLSSAKIKLGYDVNVIPSTLLLTVTEAEGERVYEEYINADASTGTHVFNLDNVKLWWPAGQGSQPLYKFTLSLFPVSGSHTINTNTNTNTNTSAPCHQLSKSTGFRKIQLVMNRGTWSEQEFFPKTQDKAPVTIQINGRKIFAKGSNLVPLHMFISEISDSDYDTMLNLVKDANMNIVRIWGGGYIQRKHFYDKCDESGILVWQEFPLSCSNYFDSGEYLRLLEKEGRSIVYSLREHPSLAIWSGGNELFNSWSKMTNQSLALRLLNSICLELDPHTPFICTSPLYGMGHGHYRPFIDNDTEALTMFYNSKYTAYTEFGCSAPSPLPYLQTFLSEEDLKKPAPGTAWEVHHAFNAWEGENDWISTEIIEKAYNKSGLSTEELAEKGNELQALMYQYMFEEVRKQWPYASMALNWCLNEPWPTAAGNSLINFPAEVKPSYYAVAEALRDKKASLRFSKMFWTEEEKFEGQFYLLNSSNEIIPAGKIKLSVHSGDDTVFACCWEHGAVHPNENMEGPFVQFPFPKGIYSANKTVSYIEIVLNSTDNPTLDSTYKFILSKSEIKG